MAVVLTINAVERAYARGTLAIQESANGHNTMQCVVQSVDGSYRPTLGHEILVTVDGTRWFGGYIDRVSEQSIGGEWSAATEYAISATAFSTLASRRYVTASIASGQTLKQIATTLVAYLQPYGVELHTSQADGPTFTTPLEYDARNLEEILNELSTITATSGDLYPWDIDYDKKLRFVQPTANQAPLFVVNEDDYRLIGDILVEPSQLETATVVIVRAGGDGQRAIDMERHYGNSSTRRWALDVPLANFIGTLQLNGLPQYYPVGIYGTDDMPYTFDWATNEIVQRADQTLLGPGDYWEMSYLGQFPLLVTATSNPDPADLVERVYDEPEVYSRPQAQAIATARLASSSGAQLTVRYTTTQAGMHPGQTQQLTSARRGITTSLFTIVEAEIRDETETGFRFYLQLVQGTVGGADWRETYASWGGGGGGSGGSVLVTEQGGGGGAGGSGTAGTLAKWTAATTLGDSLLSESGSVVTVNGTLNATAITFSTPLNLASGGTNAALTAAAGAILYSTASALALSAVGAAGTLLRSSAASAPAWTTATYPAVATTVGTFLRADGANWAASVLKLPNVATPNAIPYATAGDTWGESANLTFNGMLFSTVQLQAVTVTSHLTPTTTDTYNLGAYDRLWAEAFISTINAIVFKESTQTLFGGYSSIGVGAHALAADVLETDQTMDFGMTMAPGDWVLIRAHDRAGVVRAEYLLVGTLVSGTRYNVTRDLANAY